MPLNKILPMLSDGRISYSVSLPRVDRDDTPVVRTVAVTEEDFDELPAYCAQ